MMKTWVNTELGETWTEQGETVEEADMYGRREAYKADVPDDVVVLTAGVDTQDDRFEVEVVGWGAGKESWGITVSGKGTNSFKVRHDGSAKTVVLTLKITGGMK